MINIDSLIDNLEMYVDIEELKEFGLTDEEIIGYIEFFYSRVDDKSILN